MIGWKEKDYEVSHNQSTKVTNNKLYLQNLTTIQSSQICNEYTKQT